MSRPYSWRKRQAQIALVLAVTGVAAVASAIVAGRYWPWLGTAYKVGQEHALAPVASFPALIVGYFIVSRIIRRGYREQYEASRERPAGPAG
jgi:hypothetical protein